MANFTLTIPTTPVIRDIPNLGRVTFRPVVSIGVAMQASRASIDVTMAERATVFVNTVLAGALIDPKLQPDAIISLPEPTRTALIDALIDIWDIRTAVESTSADLPYDERIYQGYILYMAEMLKPIFTGFHSFMQNMQAQIRAIVQRTIITLGEGLTEIGRQMRVQTEDLHSSLDHLGESMRRWEEALQKASITISPSLRAADFWISPFTPVSLIFEVQALVDEQIVTPQAIQQAFIRRFSADDHALLRSMVGRWTSIPYFANRMHILNSALNAHIRGEYVISIPTLLPQIEGILTDLMGRRAERKDGGMDKWAKDAITQFHGDDLHEVSKDIMIAHITRVGYKRIDPPDFLPQTYPKWMQQQGLTGDQALQRHAILHGIQVDYASPENGLRAFLLLDALAAMARGQGAS